MSKGISMMGLFLMLGFWASAQGTWSRFWNLKRPQKCWVLRHPFAARKALNLSEVALAQTRKLLEKNALDGDYDGGQVDAFRHVLWMALLSDELGPRRARSLGKAYEKGNYLGFKRGELEDGGTADATSSQMDLHNNEVGISLGQLMPGSSLAQFEMAAIAAIREGRCLVVYKDQTGTSLDASGEPIPESEWKGKWVNERSLAPSNKPRPTG